MSSAARARSDAHYVPTAKVARRDYGATSGDATIWWWDAKVYMGLPKWRTKELEAHGLRRYPGGGGANQHRYLLDVIYALAKIHHSVDDADKALRSFQSNKAWRVPSLADCLEQFPQIQGLQEHQVLGWDGFEMFGIHQNRVKEAGLTKLSAGSGVRWLYEIYALAQHDYMNQAPHSVGMPAPDEALEAFLDRESDWIRPTRQNVVTRYGRDFGHRTLSGWDAWSIWKTHRDRCREKCGRGQHEMRPLYETYALAKWENRPDVDPEALANVHAPGSSVSRSTRVSDVAPPVKYEHDWWLAYDPYENERLLQDEGWREEYYHGSEEDEETEPYDNEYDAEDDDEDDDEDEDEEEQEDVKPAVNRLTPPASSLPPSHSAFINGPGDAPPSPLKRPRAVDDEDGAEVKAEADDETASLGRRSSRIAAKRLKEETD